MKFKYLTTVILMIIAAIAFSNVAVGQGNTPGEKPNSVTAPSTGGSGFTYQGLLQDGSGAVNDSCDFRFSLWDAVSAGSQVGGNHELLNVTVTDGYFTVVVNDAAQFGNSAFNGTSRWLQVEARCPAGGGSYTALTPRQEMTATPYATYANRAPWSGLSDAPWAYFSGSGTTGKLYHSGNIALGTLTDPDGYGLNVQNYISNKAAVRGVAQFGATIYNEGQLGVLSTGGLPLDVTNVGVLGLKPANGNNGAAVYGWNNDDNSSNYGGVFIANGSGTSNYGIYASASGASTRNVAGYFGGRVGINTTTPTADIHLIQSDGNSSGAGGIRLEISGGTNWKILHTGAHLSFAENGARLSYIESGTGTYVQPSDETLKQNVAPMGGVLDRVMQLNPVSYSYISDPNNTRINGFIAQDVETAFPELVKTDEDGNKGLAYSDFGVLAIAAIQEQQATIKNLQQENILLKTEIDTLKGKLGGTSPTLPTGNGDGSIIAQNGDSTALETGVPVVVGGIIAPSSNTAEPVLLVQRATANSSGSSVVGVVQTANGAITPGSPIIIKTTGMAQLKVDASAGNIQTGDLLAISPTSGNVVSIRSNQLDPASQVAIIGTALEPLADGMGLLWVLVDLR